MKKVRYDLPLDADPSAKFVPWIIALTTFLTILLLLTSTFLSNVMGKWSTDLIGKITLQLPALEAKSDFSQEQQAQKIQALLHYLRSFASLKKAKVMDKNEVISLLRPWLGEESFIAHLPLPTLITVELKEKAPPFDFEEFNAQINKLVPGTQVIYHEQWYADVLRLAVTFKVVVNILVVMMVLASVGSLIFATYTGLIIHKDIVEILGLIGARPCYIAQQFQSYTLKLALKGVMISFVFLAVVGGSISYFIQNLGSLLFLVPSVSLLNLFAVLLLVPLGIILVMVLTARITVGYVLKREAQAY